MATRQRGEGRPFWIGCKRNWDKISAGGVGREEESSMGKAVYRLHNAL